MTDQPTILVGIDRSAGSLEALARARSLANELGGSVTSCAVLAKDSSLVDRESARSRLADLAPESTAEVRVGRPFVQLIEAARESDADLIVVGATGEHTEGPLALGVTVDRLTRKADRPVLVVRRPPQNGYHSVLVGLDGSADATQAAHLVRRLAPQARIIGVHAASTLGEDWLRIRRFDEEDLAAYRRRLEEEGRRRLTEIASSLPIDVHEVHLGRPEIVLMDTALSHGVDLVAVGRRGVAPAVSILLGSVAHHLVLEAPCDVLVYRSKDLDFELP